MDLDKVVENTQKLYSVRNTDQPLQLKVRSVLCLCPPCISDHGTCENSLQTDPWKLVTLIPSKGTNMNKHKKHPKPQKTHQEVNTEEICDVSAEERREDVLDDTDSVKTVSYTGLDLSDEEIEEDDITFEIHDENEDELRNTEEKKKKREVTKTMQGTNSKENVTDIVTDHVTDNMQQNVQQPCSWVSVSKEITEEDFLSSDSMPELSQEDNNIEIFYMCQRHSKEFE